MLTTFGGELVTTNAIFNQNSQSFVPEIINLEDQMSTLNIAINQSSKNNDYHEDSDDDSDKMDSTSLNESTHLNDSTGMNDSIIAICSTSSTIVTRRQLRGQKDNTIDNTSLHKIQQKNIYKTHKKDKKLSEKQLIKLYTNKVPKSAFKSTNLETIQELPILEEQYETDTAGSCSSYSSNSPMVVNMDSSNNLLNEQVNFIGTKKFKRSLTFQDISVKTNQSKVLSARRKKRCKQIFGRMNPSLKKMSLKAFMERFKELESDSSDENP